MRPYWGSSSPDRRDLIELFVCRDGSTAGHHLNQIVPFLRTHRRDADTFTEWHPEQTLNIRSRPGPGGKADEAVVFVEAALYVSNEVLVVGGVASPGKWPSRTDETGFDPFRE